MINRFRFIRISFSRFENFINILYFHSKLVYKIKIRLFYKIFHILK